MADTSGTSVPSKRLLHKQTDTSNDVSGDEVSAQADTLVSEVEAFLADAALVSV